jgi:lipoate---protein ligase
MATAAPVRHGWEVNTWKGEAGVHHGRPLPEPFRRAVWVHEVVRPALVLGSAQSPDVVDGALAGRLGIEVVRRRSGGGAVLLVPGDVAWLDVLLPASDPLWEADVSRSGLWLGELWRSALDHVGVSGTEVHRGRLDPAPLDVYRQEGMFLDDLSCCGTDCVC